ncbi:MAG: hypothetical protein QXS29_09915, partial [Nitrososphaeria archaeon]
NKDINSKLCEAGGKKITLTSPQGKKLRQRMITEVAVIAREKNKCMRGEILLHSPIYFPLTSHLFPQC